MDKAKLPILGAILLASALCGADQPAQTDLIGRHVIGLDNVKRNATGKVTVSGGALQLQTGKVTAQVSAASIDDIAIGTETTQAGGKTGTAVKTAAIAAPFDSGAALSILLRTNVDVLTISNHDSEGGLHYAILALPKGQGEQQRTLLVNAGAHVMPAPSQELKEGKSAASPDPPKTDGKKLTASSILIEPVNAGDVWIPAEFRGAIYEYLVMRVRESGRFQHVYRSGDRAAAGIPDLVTLHTTVEKFKQGSQMQREILTVVGATKVDVTASVTDREGHVLMARRINGKVRFFGENLNATNDVAKRIAKRLKQD